MENFIVDNLKVCLINDRKAMARIAAIEVKKTIDAVLKSKPQANIVFASSPYLVDTYQEMLSLDIDFGRINAFHMDEYIGITIDHPASFANYLKKNLFEKVKLNQVFYINGMNEPAKECARYTDLLKQHPVDITLLGIGTNGHLAFNDPFIADFFDIADVKINPNMDDTCREQQVQDGWFENISDIPKASITITIPALLRVPHVYTIVPGELKSNIINKVLEGPICTLVPATSLRVHQNSTLFIDGKSASMLNISKMTQGSNA